jgi:hypothetical protein
MGRISRLKVTFLRGPYVKIRDSVNKRENAIDDEIGKSNDAGNR